MVRSSDSIKANIIAYYIPQTQVLLDLIAWLQQYVQYKTFHAVRFMNENHQVNQNSGNEASTQLIIFYISNISSCPFPVKDTTVVQPGELGQHQIIETTIRAPFEIYYEELLKQKRGLPLWFPGPSLDLPLTYRRNGINVGDVGIMQIDEPFDFLFNIFLPENDPINSEGVPDSFKPLGKCDISEVPCDMRDGSVGSKSVRRSVHSEPS